MSTPTRAGRAPPPPYQMMLDPSLLILRRKDLHHMPSLRRFLKRCMYLLVVDYCFVIQESQRIKSSETDIPEVPSQEGNMTGHDENLPDKRTRHSKRDQEYKSSKKRKKKTKNKVTDFLC